MSSDSAWVLVADQSRSRLLCCKTQLPNRCRIEELDAIEVEAPTDRHRSRPCSRIGKTSTNYASDGHHVEELLHRSAKQTAAWLERIVAKHRIQQFVVFAPARFLGALRTTTSPGVARRLHGQRGEFTNFSNAELAQQPAIRRLLGLA